MGRGLGRTFRVVENAWEGSCSDKSASSQACRGALADFKEDAACLFATGFAEGIARARALGWAVDVDVDEPLLCEDCSFKLIVDDGNEAPEAGSLLALFLPFELVSAFFGEDETCTLSESEFEPSGR